MASTRKIWNRKLKKYVTFSEIPNMCPEDTSSEKDYVILPETSIKKDDVFEKKEEPPQEEEKHTPKSNSEYCLVKQLEKKPTDLTFIGQSTITQKQWDILTAGKNMVFYGTLKNSEGILSEKKTTDLESTLKEKYFKPTSTKEEKKGNNVLFSTIIKCVAEKDKYPLITFSNDLSIYYKELEKALSAEDNHSAIKFKEKDGDKLLFIAFPENCAIPICSCSDFVDDKYKEVPGSCAHLIKFLKWAKADLDNYEWVIRKSYGW